MDSTDDHDVTALDATRSDPPQFALIISTPRIYFANLETKFSAQLLRLPHGMGTRT